MADNSTSPVDAFPTEVVEAFDNVDYIVSDLLADYEYGEILQILDGELLRVGPEAEPRIKFLCRLASGYKRLNGLINVCSYFNMYVFECSAWLSLRLTEALCSYAGHAKIRGWRQELSSEWELSKGVSRQANKDPSIDTLLRFIFTVLIPRVASPLPKRVDDLTEQIRNTIPKPTATAQSKTKTSPVLPQALEALCESTLKTADVRALLTDLGILSEETGRWHLGNLIGKAGKPKSAFPAAYRALVEAKLMRRVDAPVWRKLFEAEFGIGFSDRLANYAWSKVTSMEFDNYYIDATRWVTKWRANS